MKLLDRFLGRADAARPLASGTLARSGPRGARLDGTGGRWTNTSSGQGGALDRHNHTVFCPPTPLDSLQVDSLLEFQAIARRIAWREPQDATREGYELKGIDPTLAEEIVDAAEGSATIEGLGMLRHVATAKAWSRAFGGGAVLMLVDDGQPASEPINFAGIKAVRGLQTLDRHELQVQHYGLDPSEPSTFAKPIIYQLSQVLGRSEQIHASRIVAFHGNPLPMRTIIRKNGWGGSIFDLVYAELRNYATTNDYVTEAVTLLTQGVLKTKWLADAVDAGDQAKIINRMEAMRIAMGMLGDIAVDMDEEDYEVIARSLAGLKDAGDIVTGALVAASEMPRTIILGETPGGINAGEQAAEIRGWYDGIGATQIREYSPAMRKLLNVFMSARESPTRGIIPPGWKLEWLPLWQESEKDKETNNLTRAQRRGLDIQSSVITPDEARREPALVEVYGHDPNAPAPVVEPAGPLAGEGDLDDEAELLPVVPADVNTIPPGELLITGKVAAERLATTPGTVHRMAQRGQFPAWQVGSRWRYSWSMIQKSTGPGSRPPIHAVQ